MCTKLAPVGFEPQTFWLTGECLITRQQDHSSVIPKEGIFIQVQLFQGIDLTIVH